jgi:ribosomal protein L37AE/L43A
MLTAAFAEMKNNDLSLFVHHGRSASMTTCPICKRQGRAVAAIFQSAQCGATAPQLAFPPQVPGNRLRWPG